MHERTAQTAYPQAILKMIHTSYGTRGCGNDRFYLTPPVLTTVLKQQRPLKAEMESSPTLSQKAVTSSFRSTHGFGMTPLTVSRPTSSPFTCFTIFPGTHEPISTYASTFDLSPFIKKAIITNTLFVHIFSPSADHRHLWKTRIFTQSTSRLPWFPSETQHTPTTTLSTSA